MKKLVAHIIRRDRGVRDVEYMHPMREWVALILLTVVVVLIGAAFSIFYYYRVLSLETEVTVPPAPITPYDGGRVGQAVNVFTEREATFNQLQTGRVAVPVSTPTPAVEEPEISSETETATTTIVAPSTEEVSGGVPTLAQ